MGRSGWRQAISCNGWMVLERIDAKSHTDSEYTCLKRTLHSDNYLAWHLLIIVSANLDLEFAGSRPCLVFSGKSSYVIKWPTEDDFYIFCSKGEGGASPSSLSLTLLHLSIRYILAADSTTAVCNSLFLFDFLNLSLIWQNDISRLTNKLL